MKYLLSILLLGFLSAPGTTCDEATCTKEKTVVVTHVVRHVATAPVRAVIRVRHNRHAVRLCRREARREAVAATTSAPAATTTAPSK